MLRILCVLWPVHWFSFFLPVYGQHVDYGYKGLGLIRPWRWANVWEHAAHLWRNAEGWAFVNMLYDGSEIV